MYLASLSFLILSSFVGHLKASDKVSVLPVCEKKSPHDLSFDLVDKGLTEVKKPFVFGHSVKCINLEGNSIVNLDQEVFDNLPELTYLNLARNPVSFEKFMNMHFAKLETLVLDGPTDQNIQSDMNYNKIYYYNGYTRTSLEGLPPITLSNLKKLSLCNHDEGRVRLWLDHISAPSLTHLYISDNKMTEMYPRDKFDETLTHLIIDSNEIRSFIRNCTKLQYLSMDENKIENVCRDNCNWRSLSLFKMAHLKYLSLRTNLIRSIEPDAFEDLQELEILNLDGNQISKLPKSLFGNTTNLKNFSLSNNELVDVPYICELVELEILILDGNKIISIDDSSFCGLSNLKFIGLRQNSLKLVSDGTFSHLPALMGIDLAWNSIEALSENWSTNAFLLKFVNLEGNDFTNLTNMSLIHLVTVVTVCIGSNPMTMTIPEVKNLPMDIKLSLSDGCSF